MSRDLAAEVHAPNPTVDVGEVTTRCLLYGLLPFWFVPGLADWVTHRRTRTEENAGTKESLTLPQLPLGGAPTLMMTEVGVPIALTLRYEINPMVLTVQLAGAAGHEATALWDVRTAVHSDREVKPIERHIHSFLESLPFAALASLMCLHADQFKSLLSGGRSAPDAWRFVPRRRPPSRGCLAGVAAAFGTCVLLPYGEELLRCRRTARAAKTRAKATSASDEARWRAGTEQ
ncbi:diguanylate cyclase [Streptomyces sp. NPDC002845]